TGKSVVRYWPGGNFASVELRRPVKPREIVPICLLLESYSPYAKDNLVNESDHATLLPRIDHRPPGSTIHPRLAQKIRPTNDECCETTPHISMHFSARMRCQI